MVTASYDKTAHVWDARTGQPLSPPLKHQDLVASAAFSLDGTRVVTASLDKTARVWDAATGKPLSAPLPHQDRVVSAAFSPDGTRIVTASFDKTARVWDILTRQAALPPSQHRDRVGSTTFNADGTRVVIPSDDKTTGSREVPIAFGTLAEWRRTTERASPYVLANGVLSLRTLDGSAGPFTPRLTVQSSISR